MKLKELVMSIGIFFLVTKFLDGATITQKIYDAHNGIQPAGTIVNCWVNDGSSGVQKDTITFNNGVWWVSSENFNPPPTSGDTIKSVDSLNSGGVIYTGRMRAIYNNTNLFLPTGFLDDPNKEVIALSVGANKVKNRSSIPYPMYAKGWLQKNPDQKIQFINYQLKYLGQDSLRIDTTDIYTQLYFNLEKQDSMWNQGDTFIAQIYQIQGDTMWYQKFPIPIDTTKYGMASIIDSIIYTGDSMILGVKENLENKVGDGNLLVKPNPTKGNIILNQEGDFYLYNVFGALVYKGKGKNIDMNKLNLPSGAYMLFLKPKDSSRLITPEKIIYLR